MTTGHVVDRTGDTVRYITIDGQRVGAGMVEVLQVVLRDFGGEAPSRNQIRLACDNQSRGRVYNALDRCLTAGLLEPFTREGSTVIGIRITELGGRAIIEWLTPEVSDDA